MEGSGMTSFLEELTRTDELPGQECLIQQQPSINRMDMQMQQTYWPMQSSNQMHYGNQYSMMQTKAPGYGGYNTPYNYPSQTQQSPSNITPPRGLPHAVGQQSPMWSHHSPGSEKSQSYGLTSPQSTPQRAAGSSGGYGAGYSAHMQPEMIHHRMNSGFSDAQKYMHSQMPRSHMQMMVGSGAPTRLTGPVQYLYSQGPMNISVHVNSDTGHATGHAGPMPAQPHAHSIMGQGGQQVNVAVQQMNVAGQQHQQMQQHVNSANQQMYNMPIAGHGSNMHHMASHHAMMGQHGREHSQQMQMHHGGMQSAMHNYQTSSNMQYNTQNQSQGMAPGSIPTGMQSAMHGSQGSMIPNINSQTTSNPSMIINHQYHGIGSANQNTATNQKMNLIAAQQTAVNQQAQQALLMNQQQISQQPFQQSSNLNLHSAQPQSLHQSTNQQQSLQQSTQIGSTNLTAQQIPIQQLAAQQTLQHPLPTQSASQQSQQLNQQSGQQMPVQSNLQSIQQSFDQQSASRPNLNSSQLPNQPKILTPKRQLSLTPTNQQDGSQQPQIFQQPTINPPSISDSTVQQDVSAPLLTPPSSNIQSSNQLLTQSNTQQKLTPLQQVLQQPVNQSLLHTPGHPIVQNQQTTHSGLHYQAGSMQGHMMHGNSSYQYSASSNQYAQYRMGSYPPMQQQQQQPLVSPSSLRGQPIVRPGPEGGYIKPTQESTYPGYPSGYWQRGNHGYDSHSYLEAEINQIQQQIHVVYQQPQSPSNQQQIQELQDKMRMLQHQQHVLFQQHRQGQSSNMQPLRIQTNSQMSGSKSDVTEIGLGPPQISPYPMSHNSNSSIHQLERDCPPTLHTPDSRSYSANGSNMHTPNSAPHLSAEGHYKISPRSSENDRSFMQHFGSSGRDDINENMATLLQDNEPANQKKKRKRKAVVEDGEVAKVKKRRSRKSKGSEIESSTTEKKPSVEEDDGMVLIDAETAVSAVINDEQIAAANLQQSERKPRKIKTPKPSKGDENIEPEVKVTKKRGRKKGSDVVAEAVTSSVADVNNDELDNSVLDENTNSLECEPLTSVTKLKVKLAPRLKSKKDRPLPTFLKSKKKKKISYSGSETETTPKNEKQDDDDDENKRRSARNTKRLKYVDIHSSGSDQEAAPQPEASTLPFVAIEVKMDEDSQVVEKILGSRLIKRKVLQTSEEKKDVKEDSQETFDEVENGGIVEEVLVEEYYVKYKNFSYLHCDWKTADELEAGDRRISNKIKRYKLKMDSSIFDQDDDELFNPEYAEVDRILDENTHLDPATDLPVVNYLVKWRGLPYDESTWELEKDVDTHKIDLFKKLKAIPSPMDRQTKQRPKPSEWKSKDECPTYKNGNFLREYQLEGLNWLTFTYYNRQSCILADEMGLGKTIQSITFLEDICRYGITGPFLIIVPLSTLGNWQREFESWTDLNVIVYHGSNQSRAMLQEYEMYFKDSKGRPIHGVYKFNSLITTFEVIITDLEVLRQIDWRIAVIDEAHRLKNRNCKLLQGLNCVDIEHRLLLTGTPLQNNVEELFSLLSFLEPKQFTSSETFLAEFGKLETESQVDNLKALLKPVMLRRLKEDVERSLAPKEETIIEVELTNMQKKYYRAILERNFSFLAKGGTCSNVPNLMNTMMELRKCCNHPYLINGAEDQILEEFHVSHNSDMERLTQVMIQASGKLVLTDKLLPKLKADGHKVLIFSQMIRVLDIIEDYLIQKKYLYERIDGRIRGNMRQEAIDRFSKPESDRFVFLLCTRAGGLGINLTAADTVIIYDSDWNPQNDLQAQARCHRIGQQKAVKVYRLITRNTYEREMFDRASLKLGLDKAVLQSMGTKDLSGANQLTKKEIEDLLKKGAYGSLMEEDSTGQDFCEEDIEHILQRRTQVVQIEPGVKGSTFAKASFSLTTNRVDIDVDDPQFWQKWARKADLDVDMLLSDKKDLIIDMPRQRRQVHRYGKQPVDTAVNISDLESSGTDNEDDDRSKNKKGKEEEDGQAVDVSYSKNVCYGVEKGLLVYGWGRWSDILQNGHFSKKKKVPTATLR